MAVGWGILTSVCKIAITLGVQAALARLLGPNEFGLFAIGMLVVGAASYFSDIGLATGLVQKEQVSDEDVRFVFTMNFTISAAVGALIFVGADVLAAAFGKPEVAGLFRAFAPVFVFNALASVSVSLLRRSLDYRTIQLAGLAGYVVGFAVVGVSMAWLTGSVYAMVMAFAVQSMVTLGLLYAKTRHSIGLSFSATSGREHLTFGGLVLTTNLVNWAVGSIDRLIIGRLFSSANLGLYSAAYNLVHAPVGGLYPNLQSVVFSTTARMQGDRVRLRASYLDLLQSVTLAVFPAFVGVSVLAEPLVLTIYGSRWADSAPFAAIFSLMAPFLLVWAVSTPLLWNTGQKSLEAKVQLPFLGIAFGAMVFASQYSLLAVAWTAVALFAARTILIAALVLRTLAVGIADTGKRILPGMLLAIAVVALTLGCDRILADSAVLSRLVGGLLVIGLTQLIGVLLVPAVLPSSLRTTLGRNVDKHGPILSVVLRRLAVGPTS